MSAPHEIRVARVYDPPAAGGGARLLVDRLWPRGIAKAELPLDAWLREVAPSNDLRKWYHHEPERWEEFRRRYARELDGNGAAVEECLSWCRRGPVTLLTAARDSGHSQATVLQGYLAARLEKGG